jgi:VIT1/CCC1 family predicted Fe2+/Mn2+ transporter
MNNLSTVSPEIFKQLLIMQRDEETAHLIYRSIAARIKDEGNRHVVEQISKDELGHARTIEIFTKRKVKPKMAQVRFYRFLARVFGFTFAIKIMEKSEGQAQIDYGRVIGEVPEMAKIQSDEEVHEQKLIGMLNEERLNFVGSMVLGMNDALVELTGALAGLTLAFNDMKIMILSGLVTGLSASFSMAASDYLSARAENDPQAARGALYTGGTYLVTVLLLVLPYLLFLNSANPQVDKWIALGIMLTTVIVIIAGFNYYLSVVKEYSFKKRFIEMAGISLGVAAFAFLVSFLLSLALGI